MTTRIAVVVATLTYSIILFEPLSQAAEPPAQTDPTPTVVVEFAKSPQVAERPAGLPASERPAGRKMPTQASPGEAEQLYSCPMHPQLRWPKRDSCPLCGMSLTPIDASAIVVPPPKINNGGVVNKGAAAQPMTDHSSMRMSNGSKTGNGSMKTGRGAVNGETHSMGQMKMNGRGGTTMNHSAMRMGNGTMNGHKTMDHDMPGCGACMAMMGNMSMARHSTMGGMPRNGYMRPASSHSGMRMNYGGNHQGGMGPMMMGCGTRMEMMRGMDGTSRSMDGMAVPTESRSYATPPMSSTIGRCGC